MEREFEDYYESEYGVSPYLDSIGLRRHVVDVGSEHMVALNEIVLAYHCCSQSLLRDSAKIQIHARSDYSAKVCKFEAKYDALNSSVSAENHAVIIRIVVSPILVGRFFSITVLPWSYSRTKLKKVTLAAVEM